MTFVARAAQEAVARVRGQIPHRRPGRLHSAPNPEELLRVRVDDGPLCRRPPQDEFFLEELGHRLADEERMPFYLTNTLDNEELEQSRLPGFSALDGNPTSPAKSKSKRPSLSFSAIRRTPATPPTHVLIWA